MTGPITGQVALSTSAQPLSATPLNVVAFTIKAPSTNAGQTYLGSANVTSSTGHILSPGDELTYETRSQSGDANYQLRISDFYALGSSGDLITWLASP